MMNISAKTDYACKALLELTLHYPNKDPLQISTISERQGIPVKFLTQILIILKQLGLVQSIRGKKGGYQLSVKPSDIKLGTIMSKLEHQDKTDDVQDAHVIGQVFAELDRSIRRKMDDINFEDIANRQRSISQTMTFEI